MSFSSSSTAFLRHLGRQPHSVFGATNKSICWLFSCFYNPPNSDMDYGIFNVWTWSFGVCVRIHTWVGHTADSESEHKPV